MEDIHLFIEDNVCVNFCTPQKTTPYFFLSLNTQQLQSALLLNPLDCFMPFAVQSTVTAEFSSVRDYFLKPSAKWHLVFLASLGS